MDCLQGDNIEPMDTDDIGLASEQSSRQVTPQKPVVSVTEITTNISNKNIEIDDTDCIDRMNIEPMEIDDDIGFVSEQVSIQVPPQKSVISVNVTVPISKYRIAVEIEEPERKKLLKPCNEATEPLACLGSRSKTSFFLSTGLAETPENLAQC